MSRLPLPLDQGSRPFSTFYTLTFDVFPHLCFPQHLLLATFVSLSQSLESQQSKHFPIHLLPTYLRTFDPTLTYSHRMDLSLRGPTAALAAAAACAWTSKLMDFKLGQGCFTAKLQIVGRQQFSAIKPFGKLLSSFFHFFVRL